ncbi:MAG: autotransporter-associated beta strand repeat-containing protein [Candidatus Accumulibacter sp.]|jgi:autotransporter-associated beta strand protein|nr:autotransporter-associated beta strand repeat-containing protein [Accumulibacter sp.]
MRTRISSSSPPSSRRRSSLCVEAAIAAVALSVPVSLIVGGGVAMAADDGSQVNIAIGGDQSAFSAVGNTSNFLSSGVLGFVDGASGVYVYGGSGSAFDSESSNYSSSNNSVFVSAGLESHGVVGGGSVNGDVTGNTVTVNSGVIISSGGGVAGGIAADSGGNVSGNAVILLSGAGTDGEGAGSIYGGATVKGDAASNVVSATDALIGSSGNVYGGFTSNGAATDNQVIFGGGTIAEDGNVYGGYTAASGNATGNSAVIDGGANVSGGNVYGGYAEAGDAGSNVVEVAGSGTTVTGDVFGGYADSGSVAGNKVSIAGTSDGAATVSGSVYGGYASAGGGATGNEVYINEGAVVSGTIYGGKTEAESNSAHADGNQVIVNGGDLSEATIYGGVATSGNATNNKVIFSAGASGSVTAVYGGSAGSADAFTGNTLEKYSEQATISAVGGFDTIKFGYTYAAGSAAEGEAGIASLDTGASGGNVTIEVGAAGETIAFGDEDIISGSGGIIKTGNGELVLQGGNSYTGDTKVSGGKLKIAGSSGTLGGTNYSGAIAVETGAELEFGNVSSGLTQKVVSEITGGGTLIKSGDSELDLTSANASSFSGAITVAGGGLIIDNDSNVGTGTNTLAGGELVLQGSGGTSYGKNWVFEALEQGDNTIHVSSAATISGVLSGEGGFTASIEDGQSLTIVGTNIYAGGTTINSGGTLIVGNNAAFGTTGEVTLKDGAVLDFNKSGYSLANKFAFDSGSATINAADGYSETLAGDIGGAGGLVKTGSGTLVLAGANTYTGDTTISGGGLTVAGTLGEKGDYAGAIGNSGTLTFENNADQKLTGAITGDGTLIKKGGNTLTLTSATSQGAAQLEAGRMNITDGGSMTITSGFSASDSAILGLGGNGATDPILAAGSATIGNAQIDILITSGSATLISASDAWGKFGASAYEGSKYAYEGGFLVGGVAYNKETSYLAGVEVYGDSANSGGVLKMSTKGLSWDQAGSGAHGTFDIGDGAVVPIDTVLKNNSAASGGDWNGSSLTKEGEGTLVLNGANIYTGGTNHNNGTIVAGNSAAFGSGEVRMADGTTAGFNASGATIANEFVLNGGATFDAIADATLSGKIHGDGVLTKTGDGSLTLNNSSNGYGGTIIEEGTIVAGANGVLGSGGVTIHKDATLSLANSGSWANAVELKKGSGADDHLAFIEVSAGSATLTGEIGGEGGLEKTGAGTLIIGGANDYNGDTVVNSGTLSVVGTLGNGGTYDGAIEIRDGSAILAFANANSATIQRLTGSIEGSGSLVKDGGSVLILGGANTYEGATTVSGGTLEVAGTLGAQAESGEYTYEAGIALTSGTKLKFSNDEEIEQVVSGAISGSDGTLIKEGGSKLTLKGANAHGDTQVLGGTLSFEGDNQLGSGSNALGNATLELAGSSYTKGWKVEDGATGTIEATQDVSVGAYTLGDESDKETTLVFTGGKAITVAGIKNFSGGSIRVEGEDAGSPTTLNLDKTTASAYKYTGSTTVEGVGAVVNLGASVTLDNPHLILKDGGTFNKSAGGVHKVESLGVINGGNKYTGGLDASGSIVSIELNQALGGSDSSVLAVDGGAKFNEASITANIRGDYKQLLDGKPVVLISNATSGSVTFDGAVANVLSDYDLDGAVILRLPTAAVSDIGELSSLSSIRAGLHELTIEEEVDNVNGTTDYVAVHTGKAAPEAKVLSEGIMGGMGLVSIGGDAVAGEGLASAVGSLEGGATGASFGTIGGSSLKLKTGSHVDVSGVTLVAGLAARVGPGATVGGFIEYGDGDYDSHNSFPRGGKIKGSGNTDYFGVGVLGRFDLAKTADGQPYLEGSLRMGRSNNDFKAPLGVTGGDVKFDSRSNYYGLSLGGGHEWKLGADTTVDLYGRYIWTHMDGDSVTLKGANTGQIKFDDVDSHRVRIGTRYAQAWNGENRYYVGAAWEHEFDAKANGKRVSGGFSSKLPEVDGLKGSTGVAEFGLILYPGNNKNLSVDVGIQGYVGKHQGVSGGAQLKYTF